MDHFILGSHSVLQKQSLHRLCKRCKFPLKPASLPLVPHHLSRTHRAHPPCPSGGSVAFRRPPHVQTTGDCGLQLLPS